MEITTTTVNRNPGRRAALHAFAIVGFIALILIGIGLAIYTTRYWPDFASKVNNASVSLSSIFKTNDSGTKPTLSVVTATSTIPVEQPATVVAIKPVKTTTSPSVRSTSHAGTFTTVSTNVPPSLYGDSDLTVHITQVGYLTRKGDTDTFVSSDEVPKGKAGAVKFTVMNAGTNSTGSWKFEADVPTSPSQTFSSPTQDSLNPGDSVDYVLGFDNGKHGDNRNVTVTVDSGHRVSESNERNNEDSADIDIED